MVFFLEFEEIDDSNGDMRLQARSRRAAAEWGLRKKGLTGIKRRL
jgi:hypothetical protein